MEHRRCVVLNGERDWCYQSASQLLTDFHQASLLCLSDHHNPYVETLPIKQAKMRLGQEFDAVVFDGLDGVSADNLGISLGTIKAGGVLLLLLPLASNTSLWHQRFNKVIANFTSSGRHFCCIKQGELVPALPPPEMCSTQYHTDDQQLAVEAILNVVHGHRRRPLVVSADRGRGKSAALGIASAKLVLEGKQHIVITAPSLAIAETALRHAAQLLPTAIISQSRISFANASIIFVAPDKLLAELPEADLVLVDEAAAIPVAMLAKMLSAYSRLVFATTQHGYEGTGRGFTVRFQPVLQQQTPAWKQVTLNQAIRWRNDDDLEAFGFEALLLNALPVANDRVSDARPEQCQVERLDRTTLIDDKQSLKELFGLMVLAHYRTRPSDLQMLLDRHDMTVYVLRYQGHIIGTVWLVAEGAINDQLAEKIYHGQRRISGQLLPQSLLMHCGIKQAGELNYQRIMRIAVHPELQQRGMATELLNNIASELKHQQCDVIGTSFAASDGLVAFWHGAGFHSVRVGVQRDHISDSHALMMLQPLSEAGQSLVTEATQRFWRQWPDLLMQQLSALPVTLVTALSRQMTEPMAELSSWDWQDVRSFASSSRPYESCQYALRRFVLYQLTRSQFHELTKCEQQLLVMTLLQQVAWPEVSARLSLKGRAQLLAKLRQTVACLLHDEGKADY